MKTCETEDVHSKKIIKIKDNMRITRENMMHYNIGLATK